MPDQDARRSMKLAEMWKRVEDFNDIYFPGWKNEDLRLVTNALAGEVGELCDATKHFYRGGTNPQLVGKETTEHMLEESFDVFVYLILFVGSTGRGMASFIAAGEKKLDLLYKRMNGKEKGRP